MFEVVAREGSLDVELALQLVLFDRYTAVPLELDCRHRALQSRGVFRQHSHPVLVPVHDHVDHGVDALRGFEIRLRERGAWTGRAKHSAVEHARNHHVAAVERAPGHDRLQVDRCLGAADARVLSRAIHRVTRRRAADLPIRRDDARPVAGQLCMGDSRTVGGDEAALRVPDRSRVHAQVECSAIAQRFAEQCGRMGDGLEAALHAPAPGGDRDGWNLVGVGRDDLDRRELDVQLLGHYLRQAGPNPLSHLALRAEEADPSVGEELEPARSVVGVGRAEGRQGREGASREDRGSPGKPAGADQKLAPREARTRLSHGESPRRRGEWRAGFGGRCRTGRGFPTRRSGSPHPAGRGCEPAMRLRS